MMVHEIDLLCGLAVVSPSLKIGCVILWPRNKGLGWSGLPQGGQRNILGHYSRNMPILSPNFEELSLWSC